MPAIRCLCCPRTIVPPSAEKRRTKKAATAKRAEAAVLQGQIDEVRARRAAERAAKRAEAAAVEAEAVAARREARERSAIQAAKMEKLRVRGCRRGIEAGMAPPADICRRCSTACSLLIMPSATLSPSNSWSARRSWTKDAAVLRWPLR